MKRTIKCLVMAFGPAAVLPLVMACSRPAQPPTAPTAPGETGTPPGQQAPGAPTEVPGQAPTGPTGQLGTQEQMGQQPQMGQGQMGQGAMGQQPGQMQPGAQGQQQGQQGLGSGLGQQGQQPPTPSEQPGTTTGVNERALCESLASEGRMRVEDAQNGVAIVITPKAGNQLSTIRDDARRLESSIRSGVGGEGVVGAPQRSVRSGEACGLAELGRLPSVSTQLVESGNSVRIVMTTNNANEVRDLRRIARDEVNALSKAGGAQPGHQRGGAGQRGGAQPKGQQQPGQQR